MKRIFFALLSIFILTSINIRLIAQPLSTTAKFYVHAEFASIGGEFVKGDLSTYLDSTRHWSMFNTTFTYNKYPDFHFGFTLLDFSEHKFKATQVEKAVIDSYEIIKTVTNKTTGLTTSTTEKIEAIEITRMGIGLVLGYQKQLFKSKTSIFASVSPTFFRFTSNIPSTDNFDPDSDSGLGFVSRLGLQYLFVKNPIFLRAYYTFNVLPNIEMSLLPGIRNIEGGGLAHGVQFGIGYIFSK